MLRQLSQRWFFPRGQAQHRTLRPSSARKSRAARLALEALEDRFLLSATITDLGTLPGGTESYAQGINDSGQVVGYADNSYGNRHAFLYSNGKMTDLGTLTGGTHSYASGINASGQVVGYGDTSSGAAHPFLYSNGKMTDLGMLPGGKTSSVAQGINDSAQVVGQSDTSSGQTHAFLYTYSSGQMTDLGTLTGGTGSYAVGINASGQVAGYTSYSNTNAHAFLYSNGQMTDLGTLTGGAFSFPYGLNDSGQVVGQANNSNNQEHAFLYGNGKMTDLGTLTGDTISEANGIDDAGQVVGYSGNSGSYSAFLYSNGQMINLNSLLPANSGWVLENAMAINNSDQIVGIGTINNQTHAFLLTLTSSPTIAGNPRNQTVTAGQTATFTAAAAATPTPTVQWQVSTDGGKTFSNLTGATSTTLTLYGIEASQNGYQYQAVFTNSAGSATTSAATLTVQFAPIVTANLVNHIVAAGQKVTFTAAANSNPAATVQWQVSTNGGKTFTNISGATSPTLTLNNVTTAMNGYQYQAVFSNSVGSSTTSAAILTVHVPTPSELPQPKAPSLLAFFNSLLPGTVTVNSDGTETITDSIFGFPLLVSTFDSAGNLESVLLLGINVTALFEML